MSEQDLSGFDGFEDDVLEEMSTEYVPIPPGTYAAQVTEVTRDTFDGKDGEKREVLRVKLEITDPELPEELRVNEQNPVLNYTVWIDRDPQGRIIIGVNKNLGFAKFRAATGTNTPMRLDQIVQQACFKQVEVDITNESSKKNPEMTLNNVAAIRARSE